MTNQDAGSSGVSDDAASGTATPNPSASGGGDGGGDGGDRGPTAAPGPDDAEGGRYQDFILLRELAEVYLLLDNLSGSASANLNSDTKDAPEILGPDDKKRDWIEAVCEIAWPPTGSPEDQAKEIATLIRVRDYLNRKAAPASGATIAFSLLVAGEGQPRDQKLAKSTTRRLTLAVGAGSGGAGTILTRGWRGREPPSRVDLADLAFPSLWRIARDFRAWIMGMAVGLLIWLIITCFLSWNLAIGSALLDQFSSSNADLAQVQALIADAESSPAGPSGKPAANAPPPEPGAPAAKQITVRYCDRPVLLGALTVAGRPLPLDQFETPKQQKLCDDLKAKQQSLETATQNLRNWTRGWMWLPYLSYPFQLCPPDRTACGSANNAPFAASLLGVMVGGVLPIFYGLLGAGAAVVRDLSAKMRDWRLAPRDRQMSFIQLALGAVIGGCIGLFVAPSGTAVAAAGAAGGAAPATQGLLGAVHLSATALSFIAGFFVEGVFRALEALMRRVFNIADPAEKPKA